MMVKIKKLLSYFRFFPACVMYQNMADGTKMKVEGDLQRFLQYTPYKETGIEAFIWLMHHEKRFRTIFYYRMRFVQGFTYCKKYCERWLPGLETIEINGKIGRGLMVHHSYAVISPERAGKNLTVLPGVVIGRGRERLSVRGGGINLL